MHIPDGFLTPRIWGAFDAVGAGFVAIGLRQTSRSLQERAVPMMGVLSAFIFVAQMLTVPVAGGTSGHFLGGALVGILMGPWIGLLVMTIILMVQCLLFQDGGVAALGANIFNMGILGSWVSALMFRLLMRINPNRRSWNSFATAYITIVLSALACSAQLAASGCISWKVGVAVIGGVHMALGVVEGLVTATVIESLARTRPDLLTLSRPAEPA